jgi:hypothetical protein
MARKRARRLNPIRTTGALIVNPRKKKAKARKTRKHNSLLVRANRRRKARKANPLKIRANGRRRKVARKSNRKHSSVKLRANRKRRVSRRKNSLVIRSNPRRRKSRRKVARRSNSLVIRANRRRKSSRKLNRRRNSARSSGGSFLDKALSPVQRLVAKFPLVGGFLSSAVGLLAPAGLGAVSVEPTMLAAKYLGKYVPNLSASVFYPAVGLLLAALVKSTSFLGKNFHDKLAVAVAAAGGAVGYYKYRSGQDSSMAGELGALEMAGYMIEGETMAGWGEGLAQRVVPFR